ncbi:copper resistance protein NlpE [Ferrimonas sediminicola]|uniref:Copper resistance protein NlpE n=1 Tax=Ferrimonas sediminicola TaxID=2569538 RepID=A0A4U1B899_9GAMM|nr:copper resistance protein NlpE [Ferrimonas sediminicola]TKB46799.1 copper resistance protein NlpE [Ferrimonas sediminicola]
MKALIPLATACMLIGCAAPDQRPATIASTTPSPPVVDGHNARNAVDWAGTYRGTLPCPDCDGIVTELTLYADGRYHLKQLYLGRRSNGQDLKGRFQWHSSGNRITLPRDNAAPAHYRITENRLQRLDNQGRTIQGALAEQYWLVKLQ